MQKIAVFAFLIVSVGLIGCGDAKKDEAVAETTTVTEPTKEPVKEPEPEKELPKLNENSSVEDKIAVALGSLSPEDRKNRDRIKSKPMKAGTGKVVSATGDTLYMLYEGRLEDGKIFDGNYTDPTRDPFKFTLGGQVIKGWNLAMVGMLVGEEKEITIPSDLGYGPGGNQGIPPNATLIFKVKVLDIIKPGEEGVYDVLSRVEGTGPKIKNGDKCKAHVEITLTNGKKVSNTRDTNKPLEFTVGGTEVSPGLNAGVVDMQVGAKWKFRFPTALANGPESSGAPQDQTLIYNVEILEISK